MQDSVSRYIYFDSSISIHHLLTHSTGIPDYFDENTMTDYEELWNDVPMYRMEGPKDFIPMFAGQQMKFSNIILWVVIPVYVLGHHFIPRKIYKL